MSVRKLLAVGVTLSALAVAGSASADPLTYRGFVGSMNNFNSFGELGFVHGTAMDNLVFDGNFGATFDNIVTVNSITIDQRDDAGRHRMRDLRIYTSPNSFVTAQLTDSQAPQTITHLGGLSGDYFFITVESLYDAGAVDPNPGITAFTFDGTVGAPRTNLNAGIVPSATNYLEPENYFLDVITNGQVVSTTGGPVDYLYFEHADAAERSITIPYGSPQTVASIGVGFEGQIVFSANARPVPKFITVSDSNGNEQQVTIEPHTLQYGQYALATPFTNTTSLTLTLPVGAENYHIAPVFNPAQDQSTLTGITEFQAFADSIVPPANDADFDNDSDVDGNDFLIWQRGLGVGTTNETGDANDDGAVDAADLAIWRGDFGDGGSAAIKVAAVPEPAALALAALATLGFAGGRARRR